ncbi:hypothetical protein Sste5346_003899 [Sporothrix stenoceras]|uniref:Biogenesis of lysosome-related organelles complex 1 subunit 7 n=1 Tax=Sporothrix stenoceras TaxID=5173 RepID=A0ABR3ZAB7_9PEZI
MAAASIISPSRQSTSDLIDLNSDLFNFSVDLIDLQSAAPDVGISGVSADVTAEGLETARQQAPPRIMAKGDRSVSKCQGLHAHIHGTAMRLEERIAEVDELHEAIAAAKRDGSLTPPNHN